MISTIVSTTRDRVESDLLKKAIKYSLASAIGVALTQILLLALYSGAGLSAGVSNFWAVVVAAYPVYLMNRAWAWRKTGSHSMLREVLPFWGMSLAGLILSTWFVVVAERYTSSVLFISAANLAAFGVLWVAKFFLIEKYMFGAELEFDDETSLQVDMLEIAMMLSPATDRAGARANA